MPVARIYTRVPEESTELVERLRARGYTVELVDPADFRVTPADLEIQLDRMKTPEALAAAARFGREHDAEVFVAAGIPLDEAVLRAARTASAPRRNVLAEGFARLLAPFRRLGAEAHATRAAKRQQAIDRELQREAERKQRAEQKAAERAEREQRETVEHAERARHAAALAVQREEGARRREEEDRKRAEREAVVAREREAERVRAEEERQRREAEAARAAAEQAALLAEQRRLQAEQQLAEEESLRQQQAAEPEREVVAPVEATTTPREAVAAAPRPRPVVPRYAPREHASSRVMKRAFVAAACLAVLAAIGWGAYANRTPASPLSNSQRVRASAIQQEVPFGAARIQWQAQPRTAQTTVRPPAKPAAGAQKPAAPKASSKPRAAQPKRARRFATDSTDAGMVAEDQVIYHGAPKKSTNRAAAQQQQQNGVKKISDMD